ncbi:DUF3039 domain-containing protein [uncultured Corynebacterium sp.]|uniref:DUF3039 domain-containing protein n=1 Tax=uncultured Corynebacterium sp. TaxID=159447 RepID=UPI0034597D2C
MRPQLAHWVSTPLRMKAQVEGIPVSALCGEYFVPQRDGEDVALDRCERCEELHPIAQTILRLQRGVAAFGD